MREALASAAQQPLQVAARLTAEVAHQAEEGGRRLGHKDAAPADPCELYHECSVQMREQEQLRRTTAAAGVQAEKQEQANHGALAAAGGFSGKEGFPAARAATTSSQEADTLEQENSNGLAGVGQGEGRPDGKAAKMSSFLEDDVASSVPDMSAVRAAQKEGAGPYSGSAEPLVSDYGIQPQMPPATLSDRESRDTTASSSVSSPPVSMECLMHGMVISFWHACEPQRDQLLSAWQSDEPDISGSGMHTYKHYRVGKDVILRVEYISPKETKARTPQLTEIPCPFVHCFCKTESLTSLPRISLKPSSKTCYVQAVLLFLWIAETVGLAMLTQEFILKITDVRPSACLKLSAVTHRWLLKKRTCRSTKA